MTPTQSGTGTGTAVETHVTADNFVRAETDMYFKHFEKNGGFGKFNHSRDLPLGNTPVCGRTATRSIHLRCSTSMPGP